MGDNRPITYEENGKLIYRASSVGNNPNQLYYSRVGEWAAPTPDWLQKAYDDGNKHEDQILKLAEALINDEITDRQLQLDIRVFGNVWVRGHIDGVAKRIRAVVDAKALSEDNWRQGQKDIAKSFPYYIAQLSLYRLGTGMDKALLAIGIKVPVDPDDPSNKETKIARVEVVDITDQLIEIDEIKMKLMKVEAAVKVGKPPSDPCEDKGYPCPWYYLCKPEANLTVDDALDELCEQYNDVLGQIDKLSGQKDALRKEIMAVIGAPGKTTTKAWKATWFQQSSRSLDKKALGEVVDLTQYEKVSMGDRLKVTPTTQDELTDAE